MSKRLEHQRRRRAARNQPAYSDMRLLDGGTQVRVYSATGRIEVLVWSPSKTSKQKIDFLRFLKKCPPIIDLRRETARALKSERVK